MDGVVNALHEDPHMLDVVDSGFLVNTGKQLILVDAGAGSWWHAEALGRCIDQYHRPIDSTSRVKRNRICIPSGLSAAGRMSIRG